MPPVTMTIDGRVVECRSDASILEVARANGVTIPTLCHHAGVENWGACRLCMVEVTRDDWDGWSKLVASCEHPAQDGLVVTTDSADVMHTRRTVLDLLLARSPNAPVVRELARAHGIARTSFTPRKDSDKCILCAICTRVCAAVGTHAIATSGRGVGKTVGVPFDGDASDCIGCLVCARNCPTGHITFEETATTRTIWGRTFELLTCSGCGAVLGTPEQLDHFAEKNDLVRSDFERCDGCRKQDTAQTFSAIVP